MGAEDPDPTPASRRPCAAAPFPSPEGCCASAAWGWLLTPAGALNPPVVGPVLTARDDPSLNREERGVWVAEKRPLTARHMCAMAELRGSVWAGLWGWGAAAGVPMCLSAPREDVGELHGDESPRVGWCEGGGGEVVLWSIRGLMWCSGSGSVSIEARLCWPKPSSVCENHCAGRTALPK